MRHWEREREVSRGWLAHTAHDSHGQLCQQVLDLWATCSTHTFLPLLPLAFLIPSCNPVGATITTATASTTTTAGGSLNSSEPRQRRVFIVSFLADHSLLHTSYLFLSISKCSSLPTYITFKHKTCSSHTVWRATNRQRKGDRRAATFATRQLPLLLLLLLLWWKSVVWINGDSSKIYLLNQHEVCTSPSQLSAMECENA